MAGRCEKNGRTTIDNPWKATPLPLEWKAKRMSDPNVKSNDMVSWEVKAIPAREYNEAMNALESQLHSRSDRMAGKHALPMWSGVWTAVDIVTTEQQSQHQGRLVSAPARNDAENKARAVVIDTESVNTGTVDGKGVSSLAWLAVVDFFSGETLLDIAVLPERGVTMWIPFINGIRPKTFHEAVRRGNAVYGISGAQRALFEVVDADTIIVGHSFSNEQRALYLPHNSVYDTQLVCESRGLPAGLKKASPVKCQAGSHSALEDALATRELAHKFLGVGKYKGVSSTDVRDEQVVIGIAYEGIEDD